MQKHPRVPSALVSTALLIGARLGAIAAEPDPAALMRPAQAMAEKSRRPTATTPGCSRPTAGSSSSMRVLGESLSTDERKDLAAFARTL